MGYHNTTASRLARFRRILATASLALLTPALAVTALAQTNGTGRITGKIYNQATREFLAGADIHVDGQKNDVFTTTGGDFDIPNLPPGPAVLHISYAGLDDKTLTIDVQAGQTASQEIPLTNARYNDVIKLNTFVVAGELEGEAKAITQTKNAPNMVDVIDADTFPNVAGGSIGNFLQNLPGISIGYSVADPRTIQVRGMDPSMNSVTVNGIRAASAASGNANRQFEIDQISMQDVASVEVSRTARPDQDADSGGGAVNLVSKNALDHKGFNAGYAINLNGDLDDYDLHGGIVNDGPDRAPQIRPGANFYISNTFLNDKLGLILTANDFEFYTVSPATNMNVTTVSTAFGIDPRSPQGVYTSQFQYANGASFTRRHGLSFNIDYQISDNTLIFANNQVNTSFIRSAGRGISFTATAPTTATTTINSVAPGYSDTFEVARGDATSNITTAATSTSPNLVTAFAGDLLNKTGASSTFSVGSRSHFDTNNGAWDINLTLGSSLSTNQYGLGPNNPVGGATFYLRGLTFQLSSPPSAHYPTVTQLAGPDYMNLSSYVSNVTTSSTSTLPAKPGGTAVTYHNPQYGPMAINTTRESDATDRIDEFRVDVKRSFTTRIPFDVSVGVEDRHQYRDIDNNGNERYVYSGPAGIDFGQFVETQFERSNILGYPAPPMPSLTAIQNYFLANPNNFTKDPVYEIQRRDTGLRHIFENVPSAYIMSDIKVTNRMNVLIGIRMEDTIDKASGPVVNQENGLGYTDPVAQANAVYGNFDSVRSSYTKYFPNMQVRYNITPNLILRLGYNQQMARQQFGNIIPGITVNTATPVTVTVNNPNLPPILFENFDSSLEYYVNNPMGAGRFSIDAYYKKIRNFTVSVTQPLVPGVNYNVGEDVASEYPGGNIAELVNAGNARQVGSEASFIQSLGGLDPHLTGFSAYWNYTYTLAESNAVYQGTAPITNTHLPTVNQYPHQMNGGLTYTRDPYFASVKFNWWSQVPTNTSSWTYNESRATCDVYVSYRFWKNNSFYIDARNVFNAPLIAYVLVPYRTRTYTLYGPQVNVGIKGTF